MSTIKAGDSVVLRVEGVSEDGHILSRTTHEIFGFTRDEANALEGDLLKRLIAIVEGYGEARSSTQKELREGMSKMRREVTG